MTEPHCKIANWILGNYGGDDLTPLKMQKLSFYCFAAVAAYDCETEVGKLRFEAWQYGPVIPEMWERFKAAGRNRLTKEEHLQKDESAFSPRIAEVMAASLAIYGAIPAMQLVEQSHLEQPWIDAWHRGAGSEIPTVHIKKHFKAKFCSGAVFPPEVIFDRGSFQLDGIPVSGYPDLVSLAKSPIYAVTS